MTRPTAKQTTHDFDLGAAYMVVTGRQPAMYREPGDTLVTIELIEDDATHSLMLSYAAGELVLNVKRFAACRAWLYRQAKGVRS